jgi:hypothetical protein
MTSAGVHESVPAEPAVPAAGRKASAQPAALDGLRAAVGNRGFGSYVRTLARQPAPQSTTQAAPARPVTVYLASPPPPAPIHASQRATADNRRLAALIDEIDKLSNAKVIERERSEALEAQSPYDTGPAEHELALEAAEYVATHRGLEPLRPFYTFYNPTNSRFNIRAALETGVREHHSFKKAFAKLPDDPANDDAKRFYAQKEKTFRAEFTRQARSTALDMLDASEEQMKRVLDEYGLPVQMCRTAAARIWDGAAVEGEVAAILKQALQSGHAGIDKHEGKRQDLAQTVGRLKRQQALVYQLDHEAGRAALDVPINATGPKADAMMKKKADAEAEVLNLRMMWIEAERSHPILAAYRRGGDVDKVDLGTLDTDPVEREMHAVLVKLLPKLADLLEARHKIYIGDEHLSPLSIPSVVAMTKANMFIPRGSIRDGIANDLAEEAGSEPRWIIFGALVLALVTFIPSGGASLAIGAALASAGMAAYWAVHDWEQYSRQKTLSDTDLDIARSLSSEEPSLTPFVVSLVSLGLEPLALLSAFNKARRLKALAKSGKGTANLVDELNAIGAKRGKPRLGAELLEDLAGGAAPVIENLVLGYGSRAEVRAALLRRFATITGEMPERWDMVKAALRETEGDVNRELLRLVDRHMAILRDPEAWADVIADAWVLAAGMRKPNLRKALLQLAMRRGIKKMVKVRSVLAGGTFFDEVVVPGEGIVDPKLAVGVGPSLHGELSHLIQDLVVDSRLGQGASAAFRGALKHAEGTIERFVQGRAGVLTRFGAHANSPAANITFLEGENSMRTGDYVWRFTNDLLYLDEGSRRLPQPEVVGKLLDEMFELK